MKKHFARMVTVMVGFAALAISAKAQESDQVIVDVPYAFVVSGKTLPPGRYRVNELSTSAQHELVVWSFENAAGVLVVPSEVNEARAHKLPFAFREIGGQHFLTQIETAEHVFTIPVSKSAILEATIKSHQGSAGSRASGTD
jgi:hypothetical protein